MIQTLFLLILGHCVCDFALQSDSMGKGKNRFRPIDLASIPPGQKPMAVWPYWLASHAGTHAAAVYLVTGSSSLAALEMAAHAAIDYGKCANRYGIHVDQGLHIACKVLWALVVVLAR